MAKSKIKLPTVEEFRKQCTVEELLNSPPEQIVTPIRKGSEPKPPILMNFLFDASGSMGELYGEMVSSFNEIVVPSLHNVSGRTKSALRIGGVLFSDKIVPMWHGFRALDQLGDRPLEHKMFNRDGLGGQTALYRTMIVGLKLTAQTAAFLTKNTRQASSSRTVVFTDGANNLDPRDPGEVRRLTGIIRNPKMHQTVLVYFKTGQGLNPDDFARMVKDTGFSDSMYFDLLAAGKNIERVRKEFRYSIGLFSSRHLR